MSNYTMITLTHDESSADMTDILGSTSDNRLKFKNRLQNYLNGIGAGARKANVKCGIVAARASGTFTGVSVVATNTAVVNGVTFTAVASGATSVQFNVGADDTATAVNLAAAINASANALLSGLVTATSALGVVTVTAQKPGLLGNCITLASTGGYTASGARATGGTDGTEVTYLFGSAT